MLQITYKDENGEEVSENLKVETRQEVAELLGKEIALNSTASEVVPDFVILLFMGFVGGLFGFIGFFVGVSVGLWVCKDYNEYAQEAIKKYHESTIEP